MLNLLIYLSLTCADPQMINNSKQAWNSNDYAMLDQAKKRCSYYYPDAPCVKKFIKNSANDFQVLCGAEEKS